MKQLICLLAILFFIQDAYGQAPQKVTVGAQAPELQFENPKGKVIKLSKINRKRIVLLDFWASWCGPCRMANPGMVKFHEEYKDKKYKNARKGFTILSISLDKSKEKWMAAIEKDQLSWKWHMSDLGGWSSAPAVMYGVRSIPQCYLLDANGVILGQYRKAEDCKADLEKLLAE
jgi:thiol-disulfide isomerase/thioredoxin